MTSSSSVWNGLSGHWIAPPEAMRFITVHRWLSVAIGTAKVCGSPFAMTTDRPVACDGAIVGLSTSATDLSVFNASGNVHVILDVTGYFQ